jgi:hypothetical protein
MTFARIISSRLLDAKDCVNRLLLSLAYRGARLQRRQDGRQFRAGSRFQGARARCLLRRDGANWDHGLGSGVADRLYGRGLRQRCCRKIGARHSASRNDRRRRARKPSASLVFGRYARVVARLRCHMHWCSSFEAGRDDTVGGLEHMRLPGLNEAASSCSRPWPASINHARRSLSP